MKFDIHKIEGLTEFQEDKLRLVLDNGTAVLNSSIFRDKIVNFCWENYRRKWFKKVYFPVYKFHDTSDTNLQVYDKFMSGADIISVASDGDLDLSMILYYDNGNVIGHTNPSTPDTFANKKFYLDWLQTTEGNAEIFGNVIHEYMHKVGYGHSFFGNYQRQFSVPYAIGDIAGKLYLRLLAGEKLE